MNRFFVPGQIYWTDLECFCNEQAKNLKGQKVLLFLSDSSMHRNKMDSWVRALAESARLTRIDSIPANPTAGDVYRILLGLGNIKPDVVLAIGGGSAIDLAKAVVGLSYLSQKPGLELTDVVESLRQKTYLNHPVSTPIMAVPTTSGTGSEVTQWATVWDMEGLVKYSVDATWLVPQKAYIIPELTLTKPDRLTLSTGLDALCQATEAYWAKKSNPLVRVMSTSAIRLIIEALPKVLKEPNNLQYREQMCLGSVYSGLAFSNTRTTACHSISYPLTMKYGIEHGFACIMTMTEVMKLNLPVLKESQSLFEAYGMSTPDQIQAWIDEVSQGIVSLRLSDFGIKAGDLNEIASLSFTQGRMDNNPVELNAQDVIAILKKVL